MFGADLSPAAYVRKSLIAALIGNIVGALFVALPTTYMYLSDMGAGGYKKAEQGQGEISSGSSSTEKNHNH